MYTESMAGKTCPKCTQMTFFETGTGRRCTKCKYEMRVPPNDGKGGRGTKCPNCNEYKVRKDKCTGCGATFFQPD
jgi:hypothetical protein